MALFKDLLKKWFYQNSSQAASSDARIPLLDASGNPKGSDTMANIASVLGVNKYIKNFSLVGPTGATISSNININEGNGGCTALVVFSTNTGADKNTNSVIGMLQFYYGGDNLPLYTKIAGDDIAKFIEFGSDANGDLTFTKKMSSIMSLSMVLSRNV